MARIVDTVTRDHIRISDGKKTIDISYFQDKGKWDDNQCSCFLFKNPYIQKETEISEIYIENNSERCGWLFPISVLESEEDKSECYAKNMNNYLYIAFSYCVSLIKSINNDDDRLTNYLGDDVIILVLHNDTVKKYDSDFCIGNYLASFAERFYYYISTSDCEDLKSTKIVSPYNINYITSNGYELAYIKKLHLKHSTQMCLELSQYFNELLKILPKVQSNVFRFILLYQIIEVLIDDMRRKELNKETKVNGSLKKFKRKKKIKKTLKYFQKYQYRNIEYNDLRELLVNSSEKNLVTTILERKKTKHKNDFINRVGILFKDINYDANGRTDFGGLFYSFRNKIVHSYRSFLSHDEDFQKTMIVFEKIIFDILVR